MPTAPNDAPPVLREFFRVDQVASFRRVLLPAVLLLTVGPPLILFSATMKQVRGHEVLGFLGALLTLLGLLTGFVGTGLLLGDDRYVGVRDDGLVVHIGREETFHPWEALSAIRGEDGDLVIELTQGARVRLPFGKKDLPHVVERLEDWRRKSAWNLAPDPRG